ncbi:CorA metal ion transporter [Malassezia psittaci]|uniref:CorA metal ion transporter n=1 Tax=Malassezia psittaci TaxID=1821823 RepID=A0AAF0F8B3_9BASI|nr:CorA metal ion transporter [Malassezia psittaci]
MSYSPQNQYVGTPSGTARRSSVSSVEDPSNWEAGMDGDAQREQDLDAARLMSRARGADQDSDTNERRELNRANSGHWDENTKNTSSSPMHQPQTASVPIRASRTAKRFYQQQGHGSTASIDSQSHFIDHRNQSHSLSMNPNSPLAMRAMEDRSNVHERSRMAQSPMTLRPDDAAPPIDYASMGVSQGGSNSPASEQLDLPPDMADSMQIGSAREREDDVCFPAAGNIDEVEPDEAKPTSTSETHPPGYPYTFDLNAMETFWNEERGLLGTHETWPELPEVMSPMEKHRGVYRGSNFGKSLDTGDSTLYSRRPHAMPDANHQAGNRFQRKLAAFEGGHSMGSSFAPSSHASNRNAEPMSESHRPLLRGTTQHTYHGVSNADSDTVDIHGRTRAYSQPLGATRNKAKPLTHAMADKPYRFTFYSNALPNTIHARYLSELPSAGQSFEELIRGIVPEEDKKASENNAPSSDYGFPPVQSKAGLPGALPPGLQPGQERTPNSDPSTWWLDVLCPTDQEMKVLSRTFGIHPLTTEDILMEETREKIELFRNYYLVCFRSFDQDPYSPTYLEPLNMYIIVFREGTLSFHFRHTPHPQNVRRRIKQLKDYINVTSDWISYALIDDITDAFGPLIQGIEFEVDSIDELVLILKEAEQTDMLRRIGTCRKKVMGLLRLMGNKADVVKGLAKRCNEYWAIAPRSDIGLYLSDIQDHLITMTQNLNHYEMILSRSHSNYLAQISIEMTDANNQINDVLSKLTALGTVIVPMNVITGLWGMNVQVPGQDVSNLHWFGGICAVMVVIAVSGYITTVRYLERR